MKGILANPTPVSPYLPQLLVGGCDLNKIKIPNKMIRNVFNFFLMPFSFS